MSRMIQVMTSEQSLETNPELPVENRVDDWVQSRVEVAEPEYDAPDDIVQFYLQTVDQGEAEPAEDETSRYDGYLEQYHRWKGSEGSEELTVLAALISSESLFSYAPAVRFLCPRRINKLNFDAKLVFFFF